LKATTQVFRAAIEALDATKQELETTKIKLSNTEHAWWQEETA